MWRYAPAMGADVRDCRAVEAPAGRTAAAPCEGLVCDPLDVRAWHETVEDWRKAASSSPLSDAQRVELAQLDRSWADEPAWWNLLPHEWRPAVDRAVALAQGYSCLTQAAVSVPAPPRPAPPPSPSDEPWDVPGLPGLPKLPGLPSFGLPAIPWWLVAAVAAIVLWPRERRRSE